MSQKIHRPLTSLILALAILFAGVSPALAAPPTNDDFDNAILISGVPTTVTQETFEATAGFDDPTTCTDNGSVWFSFTPASDMTIQANTFGSNYDTVLSAYTGERGALTQVPGACNDDNQGLQSRIVFNAMGGTTYYFLVGFCCGFGGTGGGNLTFTVQEHELQPPVINAHYFPGDPSVYDNVQFISNSFDPENIGIQSYAWDFGDGTTSSDPFPTHQYGVDGDYTVQHSVTTFDGRSTSTSLVISVRTHDVAIMKISAPKSATVGQTRAITVAIKNNNYAETVRIDLYRSVAGGSFEFIATSTQYVPVRSGNRTSDFTFNYTFSPQDAQIGKVTFRAIVTLVNARDSFQADNEAISAPPTTVR